MLVEEKRYFNMNVDSGKVLWGIKWDPLEKIVNTNVIKRKNTGPLQISHNIMDPHPAFWKKIYPKPSNLDFQFMFNYEYE